MGLPRRLSAGPPLLLVCVVLVLASVGACGGNVVFVEDGGEGGSGGFASTNVGPQTSTFSTSSNTTVGSTTISTTVATTDAATVSSSTGGDCVTCGEFLNGEGENLCPGSDLLYDELINCVCFERCADACNSTCQGMGQPTPDCEDCIFGPCGGALNDCFNDF